MTWGNCLQIRRLLPLMIVEGTFWFWISTKFMNKNGKNYIVCAFLFIQCMVWFCCCLWKLRHSLVNTFLVLRKNISVSWCTNSDEVYVEKIFQICFKLMNKIDGSLLLKSTIEILKYMIGSELHAWGGTRKWREVYLLPYCGFIVCNVPETRILLFLSKVLLYIIHF